MLAYASGKAGLVASAIHGARRVGKVLSLTRHHNFSLKFNIFALNFAAILKISCFCESVYFVIVDAPRYD
jgi:hypothetical protein